MSDSRRRFGAYRATILLAAAVVLLSACSPDPIEVVVEPERAETCSDLIPTGTALAVQLLAAIESIPIDVLTGDAPAQGQFADLLAIGRQFDAKADSLGCDPSELNAEIMAAVGERPEPGSFAGVLLLEIMQGASPDPELENVDTDTTDTSSPDD
ncbi:MAG: hypothetical protein GY720_02980 [bacterium]|nr:hypothetical protein [bacterium]